MKPMYKRVLLKLSGEALAGDKGFGINNDVVNEYKKKADNYFLYLLISIGVLAITIITFSIILIKKKDNRHKIKNKNKLM